MKYLENDICEFKCLFDLNPNNKKNIVSVSFFKIFGGGYKNFNIYINGFLKLQKLVLKEKKYNFWIRLFIEKSIYNDKELFNKISNLEKVEIVVYSCEKYLQPENSNHHFGIFGMFVRYLPMFDFPNNDANIVMIMDMDDYYIFDENINLINDIDTKYINKLYLLKSGYLSKNVVHKHNFLYKNHIYPYTVSPRFTNFKRFNNSLITDYFKNFNNKNIKQLINSYGFLLDNIDEKLKKYKNFVYGIDENFLNFNLTSYLIDNNIPYVVNVIWSVDDLLYNLMKFSYNKLTDEEKKLIEYIIKYLFDKSDIKYNSKIDLKNNYKILSEMLYNKRDNNKLLYYFYKMFLYLSKNNNYKFIFPDELYELIKLYDLFGIYEFNYLIYYNIEKKPIIKIKSQKSFNKNEIENLKEFAKKYSNIF